MMTVAVLMGAASCQGSDESEQVIDVPDTGIAIAFMAQQNEGEEAQTRSGTPLSETETSFKVWGYKNMSYDAGSYSDLQTVFPGYAVNWTASSMNSTTSNTHGWEYVNQQITGDEQTIKYWDWGAKAYRFFAVTGSSVPWGSDPLSITFAANASPIREGAGTDDEKIAANIAEAPYFSRLWFSTGNVIDYPDKQFGKPVQLEFTKPFARVRFLFNYSYMSEGIKIKNKEFKPTSGDVIALKGDVTVRYPLTGTATKESYTATPVASPQPGETLDAFTEEYIPEGTEKWYTVLPRPSQGSYTMSVWMNNDAQPKTAAVPAEMMSWLPGYSYTYIFKILEEGGVEIELVQAAVTPWTDMPGDRTVYNW